MARVLAGLIGVLLLVWTAPAFAVPPIEDYGKLPAIEQAQLSPSGERLAFIAVVGDSRKLFVRTVAGEPRMTRVSMTSARLTSESSMSGRLFIAATLPARLSTWWM